MLTTEDEEEFEYEPKVFLQNDLEESDIESRRRNCIKFIESLQRRTPDAIAAQVN